MISARLSATTSQPNFCAWTAPCLGWPRGKGIYRRFLVKRSRITRDTPRRYVSQCAATGKLPSFHLHAFTSCILPEHHDDLACSQSASILDEKLQYSRPSPPLLLLSQPSVNRPRNLNALFPQRNSLSTRPLSLSSRRSHSKMTGFVALSLSLVSGAISRIINPDVDAEDALSALGSNGCYSRWWRTISIFCGGLLT